MNVRFLTQIVLVLFFVGANSLAVNIPKGYKQINCTITPIDQTRRHASHPHIRTSDQLIADKFKTSTTIKSKTTKSKNIEYSHNWSGYAAATNLNSPASNAVSAISASWKVPSVKKTTYNGHCAIWIGIDGLDSSTVEQIGTEHDCINGVDQSYAWFEMYPGGSYSIDNFPLNVGDVISASITYNNNVFTMQLRNITQNFTYVVPTTYTTTSNAKRNSAEWVIEAPYLNQILPLADFVKIEMSSCSATINGVTSLLTNSPWAKCALEMITTTGAPKAVSSTLQAQGSFSDTWKHN